MKKKIEKFEDIIAWQKAQVLANEIYRDFSKLSDFGFKDQICRAVVSISNNIAEGFGRNTDKEFVRFLYYAKGSCWEVKSMLYLAPKQDYVSHSRAECLKTSCDEVSKVIQGFITYLSKSSYTR